MFLQFKRCRKFGYKRRRNYLFLVLFGTFTLIVLLCTQSNDHHHGNLYVFPEISIVPSNKERPHHIENLPDRHFNAEMVALPPFACARYPQLFDVKFTNDHWQTQEVTNGTFQLFNAYLDDRGVGKNWSVRIVGMGRIKPRQTFYCQIWLNNLSAVYIADVEVLRTGTNYDEDEYRPYLMSCSLPRNKTPESVSLVECPCNDATNNLRISYETVRQKKNFVVCVKGLSFPGEDKSARLVEWIELVRILGAEKIIFYKFGVHLQTQKVLDYYSQDKGIEVVPFSLLGGVSKSPFIEEMVLATKVHERRLQEVISCNDCLYRHLQQYQFIIILDTDEVILPSKDRTWLQLMKKLSKLNRSSYMAKHRMFCEELDYHGFFEGIPPFMYMLQHVLRAKNNTKPNQYVKGFHDVRHVLAFHNHQAIKCLGNCHGLDVDVDFMQLQHYHKGCVNEVKNCKSIKANTVRDMRIWRYKDKLIRNVLKVLTELNLTDPEP